MIGIYKITSPSGKAYIGQSWNIKQRFNQYGAQHIKRQPKLFASFQKYGKDNHTFGLLHELPIDVSQEVLDKYEQLYMDAFSECGIELMNVRGAGSRGRHSDASKEKMSKLAKGKIISQEQRENIRRKLTGTKLSEDLKARLSKIQTGKKKTFEHIRKVAAASAILTEQEVIEIRKRPMKSKYGHCKKLAIEFGVSNVTISAILCGKLWKHIIVKKNEDISQSLLF